MRKLFLIRHAKSSHKDDSLEDLHRPLSKRGERDALAMARHFADKGELLDVIYSSTAERALDYAQLLSEFTGVALIPDLSFYTFIDSELREILYHLPDEVNSVAVVGHNAAITLVAELLAAESLENVPTSGIVALNCDVDSWDNLMAGCAEIEYFDYPKML